MSDGASLRVTGLRAMERKIMEADAELDLFMREGLKALAEPTARDVRSRYAPYSQKGAAGVVAKVTKPGNAIVVQTLRRGRAQRRRWNFGGLIMRHAFIPALAAHEVQIEAGFRALLTSIQERWDV